MKVALVHDWLTGMRGGEKVLEVFCEIFPDADLYTLLHVKGSVSKTIEDRRIKTSFIQNLPMAAKSYRNYLPLFPKAVEGFDLSGYDLILSSSHCVAKGVRRPAGSFHISYVFTPMRYVWDLYSDYFGSGRASLIKRAAMGAFLGYLRRWDVRSSERVDHFVTLSNHVAERIRRHYKRDAEVIYPPVDCSRFPLSREKHEDFYLVVSAFAPYKRIDIAIEAFKRLGKRLVVIGTGQDESRLKAAAGKNIEFLGWRNDSEIADYYRRCAALVFPGEEDFGIVPLEAMASGRPVIAYAKGGALETVVPLKDKGQGRGERPTGVFFHEQTPQALMEAVGRLEANMDEFIPPDIRRHALAFDRPAFKENMTACIFKKLEALRTAEKDAQKTQPAF